MSWKGLRVSVFRSDLSCGSPLKDPSPAPYHDNYPGYGVERKREGLERPKPNRYVEQDMQLEMVRKETLGRMLY
jgi:hypothetical protein